MGLSNLSENNIFVNVGNNGGGESTAVYPVIFFGQAGNVSENDYFDRSVQLASNPSYMALPYIAEVSGHAKSNSKFNTQLTIQYSVTPITLFRLGGGFPGTYRIHYMYSSTQADIVRNGMIEVMFDTVDVTLEDMFHTKGTLANDENLIFSAQLANLSTDSTPETIEIQYINSTVSDAGIFNYWYEFLN